MPVIPSLTSFTASTLAQAAQVNSNFTAVQSYVNSYAVFKDVGSQIVTKTLTFTPDASYGIDITTGGMRIQAGGMTITAGGLTVTAGNVAVTAGNLTFGAASAKIIPGATSLLFRDNGDANTNLSITDAGAVTVRAGLTVSSGTTAMQAATCTTLVSSSTITGAGFIAGSSTTKFTLPATALQFRNSGDTRNVVALTDSTVDIGDSANVTTTVQGASCSISGTNTASITSGNGQVVVGGGVGLATSATTNIPRIPTCAGVPTGAVTDGSLIVDTTNHRLYVRSGSAWKYAALT